MKLLSRRSYVLLASTAAVTGLTVTVPSAALADTTAADATSAALVFSADPPRCTPTHWGRDWMWHNGHWDHWEWDRWSNSGEWKHNWRDDRYCENNEGIGASSPPEPSS